MTSVQSSVVLQHLRSILEPPAHSTATDAELLEAFVVRQEQAAFAALLRRHGPMVWSVSRRQLRQTADAEDVFQATFLLLARNGRRIRKSESVWSFLHGVAYRLAVRARKQQLRRQTYERKAGTMRTTPPPAEAARRELQEWLDQALAELPPKYRTALVLCYLEGKTQEEAAQQMGSPLGTVRCWLARGRALLRTRLARRGLTLSAEGFAALLAASSAPATMPPLLVQATLTAALPFAAGDTVAVSGISTSVAALLRAGQTTIRSVRWKHVLALFLTAGPIAAGTVASSLLTWGAPRKNEVDSAKPRAAAAESARTDRFRDPLPPEAIARIGTVRFRHGRPVTSLGFTPDGKQLLSGGEDGVRVWDAVTGKEVHHIAGESTRGRLRSSFSADGTRVATFEPLSQTRPVHVWEVRTGKKVGTFGWGEFVHVRFSLDGKLLAMIAADSTLELWDVFTGKEVRSWKTHEKLVRCALFTPDGKTILTGDMDKVIRLWDVATGRKVREIIGLLSEAYSVALSPDGKLLASIAHQERSARARYSEKFEDRIQIWDLPANKEVRQLIAPHIKRWEGNEFWEGFRALAFSADGTMLAVGTGDDLRIWDPRTGQEVRRIPFWYANPLALAFSPDGKTLAASLHGSTISRFDVTTAKEVPDSPQNHEQETILTRDGRTLATLAGKTILLWDPTTGQERQRLEGHGDHILSLHLANDGRTAFSNGLDNTLRVWDLTTGRELRRFHAEPFRMWPRLLAVSPDARILALRGEEKSVVLADAVTGKEIRRLELQAPQFGQMAAFTSDGRTLVLWGSDQNAHVWNVAAGKEVRKIPCQEDPRTPAEPGTHYVAALSPDGRLIGFGNAQRFIALCELATGQEIRRLENLPDGVASLAFSADGRTLAWSAWSDRTVHLVEVASGRERYQLRGHKGWITSLSFSADGTILVSGSMDATVLVWDLTGKLGTKARPLASEDLDACWSDLAGDDAARAYQTMRRLGASTTEVVPYLRKRLQPVAAVDEKRLVRLIEDLDSDQFVLRENAATELEKLGEVAIPACRHRLQGAPSAEVRRRLEALVKKHARQTWEPSREHLRASRALEVLEATGTPEARQLLRALAEGATGARLTQEARAALGRLARQAAAMP
jgi:RNA polymerase sigma factor (sigma-70 family)